MDLMGAGSTQVVGVLVLALFLSAGCKKTPDHVVQNPREEARRAVLSHHSSCFKDFAAYCIDDQAFVDAIIDDVATRPGYNGQIPDRNRKLQRLIRAAQTEYGFAQLRSDQSRALVHQRMIAHYDAPPIERSGSVATADGGWIPTGFESGARSGFRLSARSPLLENAQPQTAHAAAQLLRIRQAHPDATEISFEARGMRGTSIVPTKFRWFPARDLIWVEQRGQKHRTTAPLGSDLTPLLNGTMSLSQGLQDCTGEWAHSDANCR